MVFMRITTTKILTLKQETSLKETVTRLLSLLPHQENAMLHIEDNQVMYFIEGEKDCMRIECQLCCHEDFLDKKEFIKHLKKEIEMITQIPIMNQHMTILEGYYEG